MSVTFHFRRLLALLSAGLFVALVAGCSSETLLPQNELSPVSPSAAPAQLALDVTPFTAYFTDPYAPEATRGRGGPDEPLAEAINAASRQVDVAVLNLSLDSIRRSLEEAQRRGVSVRLVLDDQYAGRQVPARLVAAGIPLVADGGDGLMHNKFAVIDGLEVWTGSLNLTGSGTYEDHNALVRIVSPRLAQDYTAEFEEMFVDRRFGPDSPANTPYPQVDVDGRSVQVYFAPEDGAAAALQRLLAGARRSVDVLAFSFTSDDLAGTLIARAKDGVSVRMVMESEQVQSNQGGDYGRFVDAGLDVRLDGLAGQMHEKVMIVDGEWTAFGSYNFTRSAEKRNDENLLIVQDHELAAQFTAEFERIYSRGK